MTDFFEQSKAELEKGRDTLNSFFREHYQTIIHTTKEQMIDDEQYYLAGAYAGGRFPDKDGSWGIVHPVSMALYGLYLKMNEQKIEHLRDIFLHSRETSAVEYETLKRFTTEDAEEIQERIKDCVENYKKPPIKPSVKGIMLNKQHGEDLLTLCYPSIPKSRLMFSFVEMQDWARPANQMASLFAHCFKYNFPDIDGAIEDMGISPGDAYEFMQTDEFTDLAQKVAKKPIMKSLRDEVRDMEGGNRNARRNLLSIFTSKDALPTILGNLSTPVVKQRDMVLDEAGENVYTHLLNAADPTAKKEGTDLTYKEQ